MSTLKSGHQAGKKRGHCVLPLSNLKSSPSERGFWGGQGDSVYRHWFYATYLEDCQQIGRCLSDKGKNDSLTARERTDLLKKQIYFLEQQLENVKRCLP